MLISPGTSDLMRAALELGVDVVGGIDPAGIDRDPIRHLDAVFDDGDALRQGHRHPSARPGDLGRWQIERIADMTQAAGLAGRVMISHAYCLGAFPPADLAPLADRLAELRISIMTCAPPHTTVPPVAWLRSRGVNVCSGSDGIRDAWSPMGNGDMLERAMLIALRYGWSKDDELAMAFDIVSAGGARALGIEAYGLAAGCRADFVLLPAENLAAAVVDRPASAHRHQPGQGRGPRRHVHRSLTAGHAHPPQGSVRHGFRRHGARAVARRRGRVRGRHHRIRRARISGPGRSDHRLRARPDQPRTDRPRRAGRSRFRRADRGQRRQARDGPALVGGLPARRDRARPTPRTRNASSTATHSRS